VEQLRLHSKYLQFLMYGGLRACVWGCTGGSTSKSVFRMDELVFACQLV